MPIPFDHAVCSFGREGMEGVGDAMPSGGAREPLGIGVEMVQDRIDGSDLGIE